MFVFLKGTILDKMIFSQSGVFRLQQLASQVHNITGIRHKLSDESDMLDMLRGCAGSDHQTIQTYFAAFAGELDSDQVGKLLARGIRPRSYMQTH